MNKKRPVLVTTQRGFVCFGYSDDTKGKIISLTNARCAIRFGCTGGLFELAQTGPTDKSKIGSVAPEVELREITSVTEVSEEAEKRWNSA